MKESCVNKHFPKYRVSPIIRLLLRVNPNLKIIVSCF
jgi:hypothetical protein